MWGICVKKESQKVDYGFLELERLLRDHPEKFCLTDKKTEFKMISGFGLCLGGW